MEKTIRKAINKDGIVIDEVLMVGGAMCYHRIHGEELKSRLKKLEKLKNATFLEDPKLDLAVALGAAEIAHYLNS